MRLLVDKNEMPKRKYDCVLYDLREDLCSAPPKIACTLEKHGFCPYLKPVELPVKDDCNGDVYVKQHDYVTASEKLAEYEDLEEQGLLLRLPCRVGDTVWDIKWWDDVQEKKIIDGVSYYRWRQKHKVTKSKFSLYDYDYFGKTVFLTKEEAKARLKELEGSEDK